MKIRLKTKEEIQLMKNSGKILHETLQLCKSLVKPGVATKDIDMEAENFIRSHKGAVPGFKGYGGFPATICSSVNSEVVHGIPSDYKLQEGDIIGIDCGVLLEGFYSDSAITVPVGNISTEAEKLLKVTKDSLHIGIDLSRPGKNLKEVGRKIQEHIEKNGFSVVRELVGHGIGRNLHEDPQVPNFLPNYPLPNIKAGMVFCIEPMVNIGEKEVMTAEDGTTVKTKDNSLSAHFEHTIAVMENETIIIT